jgi:hypothetical protein
MPFRSEYVSVCFKLLKSYYTYSVKLIVELNHSKKVFSHFEARAEPLNVIKWNNKSNLLFKNNKL